MMKKSQKAVERRETVRGREADLQPKGRPDRADASQCSRPSRNRQTLPRILALLVRGCYKIPDVTDLRKVSKTYRDLRQRGLLQAEEADRMTVVSGLLPTLAAGPAGARKCQEALGAAGLSPAAVRTSIERLRSLGFAIEACGHGGFRLTAPFSHLLVPEAVLPLLLEQMGPSSPWVAGLPYCYLAGCASTNQVLKEEAAFSPAGKVVVADEQTEGRGRLGRCWSSRPGEDLTFSVLLHPTLPPAQAPLLSLGAAVAVAETLEAMPGLQGRVRVKWPNDVLVGDKKVCGILLESRLEGERLRWAVVGIGVNVNSDPSLLLSEMAMTHKEEWGAKPRPSSLRAESGHEVARGALLADLLAGLTKWFGEADPTTLLNAFRAHDALIGRRVEVVPGPSGEGRKLIGEASGIGPAGELLLREETGGEVRVIAGEVTVLTSQ